MAEPPKKRFRTDIFLWTSVVFALIAGGVIYYLTRWFPYFVIILSLSLVTFCLYGFDKLRAKKEGTRIPEKLLHGLSLAGGFPGGWAGRAVFRHKTRKKWFLVVLILSTLIHGYLIYSILT